MKATKLLLFVALVSFFIAIQGMKTPVLKAQTDDPALQGTGVEAQTGFDHESNGFLDQTSFEEARDGFDAVEDIEDGVGPVFNAKSCGECHGNPISGGNSQVAVIRAGHFDGTSFLDHPGGSLIHSRAIDPRIQERIMPGNETRSFRMSLSILGDGFIEAIDDNALLAIAQAQKTATNGKIQGQAILVPVLEAPGISRVGRFGWKAQHASLLSFAGDAYLNEMGITTPMFPVENTANGRDVSQFDTVADPDEADNDDLELFANFMRSTKAPSRDERLMNAPEGRNGERIFNDMGCAICHVPTLTTLPAGTLINGGTFMIPAALGDKTIHPFSDFLLHDIGTGDGIVQNGGLSTRNKIRTPPLWGLRTRNQYLHDGATLSLDEAILRHRGEASDVIERYKTLSRRKKDDLFRFLDSL